MVDPSDAELEAGLAAATPSAFAELWAAADALAAEETHGTWVGGVERELRQMPYVDRSAALDRVHTALGGVGALVPFDWPAWGGLARYRSADDVAKASVADAVRLVTALVRGDRFNEGLLLAAADDGRLAAAIAVIRTWSSERSGRAGRP